MLIYASKIFVKRCLIKIFLFTLFYSACNIGCAQGIGHTIKGRVYDSSTLQSLYGVSVYVDTASVGESTDAAGEYELKIKNGGVSLRFVKEGYQEKRITEFTTNRGEAKYFTVFLSPLSEKQTKRPSAFFTMDSFVAISMNREFRDPAKNEIHLKNRRVDVLTGGAITESSEYNSIQSLQRLNGVIIQGNAAEPGPGFNLFGMGERYNQLLINGVALRGFSSVDKLFFASHLPVDIIKATEINRPGDVSRPADASGGIVDVKTEDFPENNFIYVLGGLGFSADTKGKNYLGDKWEKWEFTGLGSNAKKLPSSFPTIRSRATLNQKNIQDQSELSRQLRNNLAPVDQGKSSPDERILLGYGKTFQLKQNKKIGVLFYLSHQRSRIIEESITQVAPNTSTNPFPFIPGNQLISSESGDINYRDNSQTTGILNVGFLFGHNKVSVKSLAGTHLTNVFTNRFGIAKPDEDTLAHRGLNYQTSQQKYFNVQLLGEHALGTKGILKLDWVASYTTSKQSKPDERQFLLRTDSLNENLFSIANADPSSLAAPKLGFTNTSRSWSETNDHNFTAFARILVPFYVSGKPQTVSGGVSIENIYRTFYSDVFLVQGPGYFALDKLLSPENYFPGGLTLKNYYIKNSNGNNISANQRGSYTGSSNIAGSYLMFGNKLSRNISLNWGVRLESGSMIVSSSQYNYYDGFKNPRILPLDQNTTVAKFNALPSATLKYNLLRNVEFTGSFYRTVNRPQIEELSRYTLYNSREFIVVTGNPLLKNSDIDNYDAGISYFMDQQSNISVSGFIKKMKNPIEQIIARYGADKGNLLSTPNNTPDAEISGVNASFRIKFNILRFSKWLSHVTVFGNGTFLSSKVSAGPVRSILTPEVQTHSLSGSPDYSLNGGIVFQPERGPFITLVYFRYGDYITAVGSGNIIMLANGNTITTIPDYRIKGREQLNIQIAQALFKRRLEVIAGVTNLLGDPYIKYQDLNGNNKFDGPLVLTGNNDGGHYQGGVDNTIINIKSQASYYLSFSYRF